MQKSGHGTRPKSGVLLVDVFCHCKMPAQYDMDMIECETCQNFGIIMLN